MAFVHLHNHTEHSTLDGATRIKSAAKAAAALGQNAMAITDHGPLAGAWKFTKACKAAGIKPIIGVEFYMSIGSRFERNAIVVDSNDDSFGDADEGAGKEKVKRYEHLTVLARTQQVQAAHRLRAPQGARRGPHRPDWLPRGSGRWTLVAGCTGGRQRRDRQS